jgi:hypothetical protein
MSDVVYINKHAFSWGDLKWIVTLPDINAQSRFYGFKSIALGAEKRERPHIYGQNRSQAPMALPKGKYTPPSPKITWHAHASDADSRAPYEAYLEFLKKAAPDGRSFGEVRQHWILQVDNPGAFSEYVWHDVFITSNDASWEETAEGLLREQEFTCLRFYTNGGTLFDSSEE